jgi:hypothetical protein
MRGMLVAGVVWLGACGAGLPGGGAHACSDVGCEDQFTATVHDANGALPSGMHALTVTAGAAILRCVFTVPLATLPGGGTAGLNCPAGLQVQVLPKTTCVTSTTPSSKMQACTPVAGKLDELIIIAGKPASLHVTQTIDGATYLDQTVTPTYTTSRPNGPGCEPLCSQASAEWVLAAP